MKPHKDLFLLEKRTTTKYTKKLAKFRAPTTMARMGRYEEEALHKAGVETNRPRVCGAKISRRALSRLLPSVANLDRVVVQL
jgi:hypothetical protein